MPDADRYSLGLRFTLAQPDARQRRIASEWLAKSETADNRFDESCFHALSRIATAVISRRGKLYGDKALLTDLAVTLVCNDYGSEVIGHAIEPFFQEAVSREGFRPLPPQAPHPSETGCAPAKIR